MKPPAPRLCDRCREACKQPEGTFVLRCGWYAAKRVDGHTALNSPKPSRSDSKPEKVG